MFINMDLKEESKIINVKNVNIVFRIETGSKTIIGLKPLIINMPQVDKHWMISARVWGLVQKH